MSAAHRTETYTGTQMLIQDAALAEVVRRLVEAYQPERVYLFGCKAQGDAGVDSDYDLMVDEFRDAPRHFSGSA
jgi:predicted nucleotidyltransferase